MSDLLLHAALADYDAAMKRCPVNTPVRGRIFGHDDRCPQCRAKASESCGIMAGASYAVVGAVRSHLLAAKDPQS